MRTGTDRFGGKGRLASIQARREQANQLAAELAPTIAEVQAGGAATLQEIATALNERDITAARGGRWSAVQVRRLLAKLV